MSFHRCPGSFLPCDSKTCASKTAAKSGTLRHRRSRRRGFGPHSFPASGRLRMCRYPPIRNWPRWANLQERSAESRLTAANASAAALRRAEEARRFIAHPLWRSFSEMIEPVLLGRTGEGSLAGVKVHEAAGQDALEEQVVPLGTGPEGPQEGVPL